MRRTSARAASARARLRPRLRAPPALRMPAAWSVSTTTTRCFWARAVLAETKSIRLWWWCFGSLYEAGGLHQLDEPMGNRRFPAPRLAMTATVAVTMSSGNRAPVARSMRSDDSAAGALSEFMPVSWVRVAGCDSVQCRSPSHYCLLLNRRARRRRLRVLLYGDYVDKIVQTGKVCSVAGIQPGRVCARSGGDE